MLLCGFKTFLCTSYVSIHTMYVKPGTLGIRLAWCFFSRVESSNKFDVWLDETHPGLMRCADRQISKRCEGEKKA